MLVMVRGTALSTKTVIVTMTVEVSVKSSLFGIMFLLSGTGRATLSLPDFGRCVTAALDA